jgi:hypothetical protein
MFIQGDEMRVECRPKGSAVSNGDARIDGKDIRPNPTRGT